MSTSWQETYTRLQNFITANPRIELSESVVAIPGDIRPEFYRLFDDVRAAFVEEKFPALLSEAETLSENYTRAEQEVKELLKLDNIFALGFLDRFLHQPKDELMRGLWDPLFGLVQGKTGSDVFEQLGSKAIAATFQSCHRLGYAKWVALSLVKMLEADKLFSITNPESKIDGHNDPICSETLLPSPEESKVLSFEHGQDNWPPYITPHFIIRSARLNRYVSFRSELMKAEYIALDASEKREWYRIESMERELKATIFSRDPSLLIYIGDEPEELVMIADKDSLCRPDIIVEYREPQDWDEVPKSARLYDILNPKLGRYIVSREPVPEQALQESAPGPAQPLPAGQETEIEEKAVVRSLTIGFDQSSLEPIVKVLEKANSRDIERMVN